MTVVNSPQDQMFTPDTSLKALKTLESLVGTWELTAKDISPFDYGEEWGERVSFEWMEGGFFLVRRSETKHGAGTLTGVEYIGYDVETKMLRSRRFDSMGGTYTYTWQLQNGELNIRVGDEGPRGGFTGTISADGTTITGGWKWGDGAYEATMTKVDQP